MRRTPTRAISSVRCGAPAARQTHASDLGRRAAAARTRSAAPRRLGARTAPAVGTSPRRAASEEAQRGSQRSRETWHMTARLARPSHQRHPRSRRVRRRHITARILPHFTPRQPGRRIAPPGSERGLFRFDARQHNVERRLGAQRAFEPATRAAVAARRCGESARECLELAEKMRAAHSSGDESDANGYETDTIDWTHLMMTMVTNTAMSRLRLFHLPKLFTSPPTSFASRPSPRRPSWSERIRPRSIGKLRCLYSGQRISATCTQTILLVRELGQRSKRQCIGWWHTMRYVTCHVSYLSWRAARAALAHAHPRTQRTPPAARRRCRCLLLLQT